MALAGLGALTAAAPVPGFDTEQRPDSAPTQSVGAVAGPDGLEATVTSTSQVGGTVPFQRTVHMRVPAMCWMTAGPSGAEYAANWGEGGTFFEANGGSGGYAYIRSVYPDFEQYADKDGSWYTTRCRTDAPPTLVVEYLRAHPPRFVETGTPAPQPEPDVDPRVLVQAARDAVVLPTGQIRWNPSVTGSGAAVVNLPTFVWVEGSTTAVQVRAEIPTTGTWAQIDATLGGLDLAAEGADPATCADNGTPYTPGMTSSSCAIQFTRSTAGRPVKAGQTLPTTTLTATARWTATWTSSLGTDPQPLDVPATTTTAEVPVAEIQTIVTR